MLSVIKSDSMYRKMLLLLLLLFLLSGCGQRRQPDVEHFQGDVVATLQKPVSQPVPDFVEVTPPPSEDPQPSPQASQVIPTNTPEGTLTPTSTESNPQVTGYPVSTETASLTPTPSRTANPVQTPTPTLGNPVWEGVWKIWYQMINGGYIPAELTIQVSGTRVTGSAKIDGKDYTFDGDITMQGTQVVGEWETTSTTGTFWWRINSADTFVGSRENRFGFCGNRGMAVQPNPCREIPQD